MADLYHELWTAWAAVSDGPFMQFGDVAAASKYGAWGIFSALGDHNPRADLLMELNAHSASWFGDGGGDRYQQGVILVAGDAGETLTGTNKDDFLIGGKGNDVIVAGKGHDAISGGKGQDTLVLSGTAGDYKIVAEGDGYRLTGPNVAHFLKSIENFQFGGEGAMSLSLAHMQQLSVTQGQVLAGTFGDDFLIGTAGDDTFTVGTGHDTIIGGAGNDVLQLTSGAGAYTLVVEGDGYRLTGANTSVFLQDIEGISTDSGPIKPLENFLTPVVPLPPPATLHMDVLGDMVDGAGVARVQIDADSGTGVIIRGIAPSVALGRAMGLDRNSDTASYSVAAVGAHANIGDTTVKQNYWSIQQNQADGASKGPLTGDAFATAMLLGSVATSVHGIVATNANDRFLGWSQNDVVNGAGGDDHLAGRKGNDILSGDAGNDVIIGGKGHDVITGGTGDDVMSGGKGHDEFCFFTGDGNDRINDFRSNDMLNLIGRSIASHDALIAMASEDASGNLTIGDDYDSITLVGLHLSDLSWMHISL